MYRLNSALLALLCVPLAIAGCAGDASSYRVALYNGYFEPLTQVTIADIVLENVAVGETTAYHTLRGGQIAVTIVTQSKVQLGAHLTLRGERPTVLLRVTPNGDIVL